MERSSPLTRRRVPNHARLALVPAPAGRSGRPGGAARNAGLTAAPEGRRDAVGSA